MAAKASWRRNYAAVTPCIMRYTNTLTYLLTYLPTYRRPTHTLHICSQSVTGLDLVRTRDPRDVIADPAVRYGRSRSTMTDVMASTADADVRYKHQRP